MASCPPPRIDQISEQVTGEAVEQIAKLRTTYWLADAAVHLHALTSLIMQAQQLLPAAVADARDQDYTWAQIGQLLNLTPRSAARRYRTPTGAHR